MKTCAIPSCGNKLFCKGYCIKHYMRHHRHGDPLFVWGTNVVINRERKKSVMKESYLVYYHCTVTGDAVVNCYSPAEAKYIIEKRMKKRGDLEPVVDSVILEGEDRKLNAKRDFAGGPGYGA